MKCRIENEIYALDNTPNDDCLFEELETLDMQLPVKPAVIIKRENKQYIHPPPQPYTMNRFKIRCVLTLVLNLVLCVSRVGATQELRSNMDSSRDRNLQFQQYTPPPNDECENAFIIPSLLPGTTYSTPAVQKRDANRDDSRYEAPPRSCTEREEGGGDVWYQFSPASTGLFDFFFSERVHVSVLVDGGFANATCRNAVEVNCQLNRERVRDLPLNASRTYYIYVKFRTTLGQPGIVNFSILHQIHPTNALCTNATVIDPTLPQITVSENNEYGLHDKTADAPCQNDRFSETFWYTFTNPYPYTVNVATTIGDIDTYGQIGITAFRGSSCGSLSCVGGSTKRTQCGSSVNSSLTYDFDAEGQATYYIVLLVQTDFRFPVIFNATIDVSKRFFSIVDSRTDVALRKLSDVNYEDPSQTLSYKSINLNIRASFESEFKSARVRFDNPKRNLCERVAPFAVFGDTKGDYKDVAMPLGQHTVTATPYAEANCTGTAGTTMKETFNVTGCRVYSTLSYGFSRIYLVPGTVPINSLPCRMNIGSTYSCGFPVDAFRVELRNGTTSEVILEKTQARRKYSGEELYLFNFSDTSGNINTGRLAKGSYTISYFIDSVKHPSVSFIIANTTCGI